MFNTSILQVLRYIGGCFTFLLYHYKTAKAQGNLNYIRCQFCCKHAIWQIYTLIFRRSNAPELQYLI